MAHGTQSVMALVRHDGSRGGTVGVSTPTGVLGLHTIIAIGRNYAEHAKEQGLEAPDRPMVFTKLASSACMAHDAIVVPRCCVDPGTGGPQVDYEAELAVVIGRPGRDVPLESALEIVLGYCCGNDVSARWWQKEGAGGQFVRGKSFDTFCPLGPWVVPADRINESVGALAVRCRVNGELRQDGNTRQMMFPVAKLISELSRGTTLQPGTVILTGTPSGVGMAMKPPRYLAHGDVVEVEIEGVGSLLNRVVVEGA